MDLVRHLKPLIILFFSNLTISLYVDSDTILLGIMQNNYIVGIYSIAAKVYSILKQIVAAVIVVVLPRLGFYKGNNNEAYIRLIEKIVSLMILFTIPLSLGVSLLSKEIITVLSGPNNIAASIPLSILSIAVPISAISTIYGNGVLLLHNDENKILMSTLIGAVINIGLNTILIPNYAENAAASTTLVSEMIVLLLNYYFAAKYVSFFSNKIKKICMEVLVESLLIIIIVFVVKSVISSLWLVLILSGILSLIAYIIILYIFKEELFMEMLKQAKTVIQRRFNNNV